MLDVNETGTGLVCDPAYIVGRITLLRLGLGSNVRLELKPYLI